MPIYLTLATILSLFLLGLYVDFRKRLKLEDDSEYDLNDSMAEAVIILTPYTIFFYADAFWFNLALYAGLWLFMGFVQWWLSLKSICFFSKDMWMMHSSGSLVLLIVLYFLFYHEGVLVDSDTIDNIETVEKSASESPAMWPYITYAILILGYFAAYVLQGLRPKAKELLGLFNFIMAIVFPLLAMFTAYFWWLLLISSVVNIVLMQLTTSSQEESVKGGFGFVAVYFMMMSVMGSIMIYAFLF